MLLALVTIQRKQTFVHLKITETCMSRTDSQFLISPDTHIKQSRQNYTVPPVLVLKYIVKQNVCP